MEFPQIDIIVPTYNRPDDIKRFVSEIQKQTYPNFKVYIIDDCSPEPIEHLVPIDARFDYIRLTKNGGQTFARNYALEKSHAEIVVFMDDDAWFEHDDALFKIANYFLSEKSPNGLMFNIKEPNRNRLSDSKNLDDLQEIGSFIACGCAFLKKDIQSIGGFSSFLHSYGEETDICLKLIQQNKKLLFAKQVNLFHNYLPGVRSRSWHARFHHNSTQNDLLVVLMNFPAIKIAPYIIGKFISQLRYSITTKVYPYTAVTNTIKGLFSFVAKSPQAIRLRKPVNLSQFNHWLKIRW
jgi:glycosyltransferase involved in cell wall biosynthesis